METTTRLILPEVKEALDTHPEELLELTEELHPADLADLATALEPERAQKLLKILPAHVSAKMLEMCAADARSQLFATLATHEMDLAASITDLMAPDDPNVRSTAIVSIAMRGAPMVSTSTISGEPVPFPLDVTMTTAGSK